MNSNDDIELNEKKEQIKIDNFFHIIMTAAESLKYINESIILGWIESVAVFSHK